MPDLLTQALGQPGLGWLVLAAFMGGLVRGFAGFGTALIYLPVAAQVLSPIWAVTTLILMDVFGPMAIIPAAFRQSDKRDLGRLVIGMVLALPVGLVLLYAVEAGVFRVAVSVVSVTVLIAMVGGLRYHGVLPRWAGYGIGGMSGVLGGAVATPGPPVIMLYMASSKPAAAIRANITCFLFVYDVVMLCALILGGVEPAPVVIGLGLALPILLGVVLGTWMFRPGLERVYRGLAYVIIAVSALSGLMSTLHQTVSERGRALEFHEVEYGEAVPVEGYGPGFFRLRGEVIRGAMIVTATGARGWSGYDDAAPLLALAGDIDVLFVGTGAEIAHLPKGLRSALEEVGIGVEVMNSPSACRTYNVLVAEGRRVALAVLPV